MISIDSAQIDAWIVAFIFPLSRILGFIATAPALTGTGASWAFSNRSTRR